MNLGVCVCVCMCVSNRLLYPWTEFTQIFHVYPSQPGDGHRLLQNFINSSGSRKKAPLFSHRHNIRRVQDFYC